MNASDLESIIRTHPILFASLAACAVYVAACSVWGYLGRKKARKLEKETNSMNEQINYTMEDFCNRSVHDKYRANE